MTAFLDLDGRTLTYLLFALRLLRAHLRRGYRTMPPPLAELERIVSQRVSDGHDGSFLADAAADLDAGTMLLLTIADAAAVLALSESSVKRLVASGELPSLLIGGARRLHRDDVEEYVDRLRGKAGEKVGAA